jgi:GxxExxY protein
MKILYEDITSTIIGAFYETYNTLGAGFLEKVYENALLIELKARGLSTTSQYPVTVYYKNLIIGGYIADIMVEEKVICEVKAVRKLLPEHEAQLLNYLKVTNMKVGLLLNYGPKP